MNTTAAPCPWFVKRDIDGFFGLFIDNLLQLLVIVGLCRGLLNFPAELVYGRILPGAALSVLLGNIYYAWLARRIGRRLGRTDLTALPCGINTPQVFAYIFLVMLPVYQANGANEAAATLAWQAGLLACLVSGAIEASGFFIGETIRRWTPRAALLAALAAISITFVSMEFMLRIYTNPLVAFLPLGLLLIQFFGGVRLPFRLPAGLVAIVVGTALYWLLPAEVQGIALSEKSLTGWNAELGLRLPVPVLGDVLAALSPKVLLGFVGIIVPMGVMNLIGSLQNIESAEAAGDPYPAGPCMLANGLGSIAAACFGSCFPTTIYIGHPGWKTLGARTGYSILNGAVMCVICLTGLVGAFSQLIPIETVAGILIWIAVIIGAQAFRSTPGPHAVAIVLGFFPAVAAYAKVLVSQAVGAAAIAAADAGASPAVLQQLNLGRLAQSPAFTASGMYINGILALDSGFILTCMILTAVGVFIIERRFLTGATWLATAALLSLVGILHGYHTTDLAVISAIGFGPWWRFALAYLAFAGLLVVTHFWVRYAPERISELDIIESHPDTTQPR